MPFFLNFNSGSSIPSVLLCERCIHVSAHGRRGTFDDLVLIWFHIFLIYNAFIGDFDSYLPFGIHFLAWDHLYLIYCLPCFFPWALCYHSLGHLNVTWMEPQNSIPDPFILVYFTRVKQDFNAYIAIRENC